VVPRADAGIYRLRFIFDSANNQITVEEKDGIYENETGPLYISSGLVVAGQIPCSKVLLNGSTYLDGYGAGGYARNNETISTVLIRLIT